MASMRLPRYAVQLRAIEMPHRYAQLTFTESVQAAQRQHGSHLQNARRTAADGPSEELGPQETDFIAARDSFYMATVSDNGWPYIQHRGGERGFLKVISPTTLAFPDFRGNMQYLSVGNLSHDNRVSLILVDYPNRRRLKLLGHARVIGIDDIDTVAPGLPKLQALLQSGAAPGHTRKIERIMLINVVAHDWNCPQYITPRYTEEEFEPRLHALKQRIAWLEAQLRESGSESQGIS